MIDKIIEFLNQYLTNIDYAIKKVGKYKTISAAIRTLIERNSFTVDELRKSISLYIKRIISEEEFNQLLDYDRVEYALLFYR